MSTPSTHLTTTPKMHLGTHVTLFRDQVQVAFLDAQQVRCGRHDNVDKDLWDDGDEGVLPGEGVEKGHHSMDHLGQGA